MWGSTCQLLSIAHPTTSNFAALLLSIAHPTTSNFAALLRRASCGAASLGLRSRWAA